MKLCYFDAFSGISGDMTVGALLDAGASFDELREALSSLDTGAAFRAEKVKRRGIAATKFHVDAPESKAHRHLQHIDRLIDGAGLPDRVKTNSKAIFRRLAESEAKVHASTIDKVHFHEVGAVDSICDIVGACFCLENLGIQAIACSEINVGSGTVNTEHGVLPVPAPATADLLTGKPIYARGPAVELTTPTGAALVSTLAQNFGAMPPLQIGAAGYGAGDRNFEVNANVLRVLIGETTGAFEATSVTVIETNIDNTTPEILGYTAERLLEAGALDVTLTPVQMKKSRPGCTVGAIARPEDIDKLASILFAETGTLGVRFHTAERRVLSRELTEVETAYGPVRVKFAQGGSFSPEYEDCRRLALERGIPLRQVMAEASAAVLEARTR